MTHPRRTFVLRVRAGGRAVVLEDAQTGEQVRLAGLGGIEDQIGRWLAAEPVVGMPLDLRAGAPSGQEILREHRSVR